MKASKAKTAAPVLEQICDHCYLRIGTGERHVVKARKAYHTGCYLKHSAKAKSARN